VPFKATSDNLYPLDLKLAPVDRYRGFIRALKLAGLAEHKTLTNFFVFAWISLRLIFRSQ
jgi:hypothetical protein